MLNPYHRCQEAGLTRTDEAALSVTDTTIRRFDGEANALTVVSARLSTLLLVAADTPS